MYVVVDGALSARVTNPCVKSMEVNRIRHGELLGEMACIDPGPRTTTVVASTDAGVFELRRKQLLTFRETDPRIYTTIVAGVIKATTQRLRQTEKQLDQLVEDELHPWTGRRAIRPVETKPRESRTKRSALWWIKGMLGRLRGAS